MTFYDNHSTHEVLNIGTDDDAYHRDTGICTLTGWCSLTYYVAQYATSKSNQELTAYCTLHYPEYFI